MCILTVKSIITKLHSLEAQRIGIEFFYNPFYVVQYRKAHYPKRNATASLATNPLIYASVLPASYAKAMLP